MRKQVWLFLLLSLCFLYQAFAQAPQKFEKEKIILSGQTLIVEVADTDPKRERGLMQRTSLKENAGMIFIFDDERILNFWMKDTLIPLDIGYFDKTKTLIDIQSMQPISPMENEPKIYPSKKPAQYALEMPLGWYAKHKVKVGAKYKPASSETLK